MQGGVSAGGSRVSRARWHWPRRVKAGYGSADERIDRQTNEGSESLRFVAFSAVYELNRFAQTMRTYMYRPTLEVIPAGLRHSSSFLCLRKERPMQCPSWEAADAGRIVRRQFAIESNRARWDCQR